MAARSLCRIGRRCFATSSAQQATKVSRDTRFARVEAKDVKYFSELLGSKGVIVDKHELEAANTDWMRKFKGSSELMLRPRSTSQVSDVLRYSFLNNLAIVPQGGNTGLVGGSVPVFDEIILNLGAMNSIISFDEVSGILTCEAGCILEKLDNFLLDKGYTFPLDLGAKGSCQIGGNVSTNAGGLRLLRYGSLHGNVIGLEVVLSNGTVLDLMSNVRKDNTGYDMKQLFIGAEGTLGVVTKVAILTPTRLPSVNVVFLACSDYLSCQKMLVEAKKWLGEVLSAFEFIDSFALEMVLKHSELRHPLPTASEKFYLLLETTGSNEHHDKEKLTSFLEFALARELVVDGAIAQDGKQISDFWRVREGITEALGKAGAVYKYDLSIPVNHMYDLVVEMRKRLEGLATVVAYGHLGDGNIHLNVSAPAYDEKVLSKIEPFVYEWTAKHKGSVSAEHGLGLMKAYAIHYNRTPEAVLLMSRMKNLLDPKGILNPYKILQQ